MQYFYHLKPENMQGNILYPLSELMVKHPKLGKEYAEIYQGRKSLLTKKIEPLDCQWQDVLFLSAINPSLIFAALDLLGLLKDDIQEILEFPIECLAHKKACLYFEDGKGDHFKPLDVTSYQEKEEEKISLETWSYFLDCKEKEKDPLIFYGVPHILLQGELDIRDAKIIKYQSILKH